MPGKDSHSRNTYLSAQYRRLAGRRGKKRAIVAVGHTMLVMLYHMLRDGWTTRNWGTTIWICSGGYG